MVAKKNTKGTKASTGNLKRVSIILSDDDELADLENQAPVVAPATPTQITPFQAKTRKAQKSKQLHDKNSRVQEELKNQKKKAKIELNAALSNSILASSPIINNTKSSLVKNNSTVKSSITITPIARTSKSLNESSSSSQTTNSSPQLSINKSSTPTTIVDDKVKSKLIQDMTKNAIQGIFTQKSFTLNGLDK